jgi:integrase
MNYLSFVALNSEGEPGLMPNTIGKQNKNLKAFFNWCFDKNIVKRFSTKLYPTIVEDVDKIYLTEEDLTKIEKLKLTDNNQITVRDLFLVGCETALRFSDLCGITEHDFRNNELHITPKKTKKVGVKKIISPLSDRFQKIYDSNKEQIDTCCIKPRADSPTIDEKLFLIDTDAEDDPDDNYLSLDKFKKSEL